MLLQLRGNDLSNTAKAFSASRLTTLDCDLAAAWLGTSRSNDDGIRLAFLLLALEMCCEDFDRVRNFWDEDGIGPSRETSVESNPAGVPSHDLDDHDAPV